MDQQPGHRCLRAEDRGAFRASQAKGLDAVFRSMASPAGGAWLLALLASGLACYGLHCLIPRPGLRTLQRRAGWHVLVLDAESSAEPCSMSEGRLVAHRHGVKIGHNFQAGPAIGPKIISKMSATLPIDAVGLEALVGMPGRRSGCVACPRPQGITRAGHGRTFGVVFIAESWRTSRRVQTPALLL
jgi:hypothetical protein